MFSKIHRFPAFAVPAIRRRDVLIAIAFVALVIALVVLLADPALAAPDKQPSGDAGASLGKTFQEWAKWLIPGTAALVGIPAMARGDMSTIVPLILVVMVLGAFAFMTASGFHTFVQPIVDSLTGGTN